MTLRYLAVAQLWEIRSNFGMSRSELYRSDWRTIDTLTEEFQIDIDLSDHKILQELEMGFANKSRIHALRTANGSLDGCFILQKTPCDEVQNSNLSLIHI